MRSTKPTVGEYSGKETQACVNNKQLSIHKVMPCSTYTNIESRVCSL